MLRVHPAIGVDWALVNEAAAEWSRQYAYDLVRGITAHTREALARAVSGFFEEALTREELVGRIGGLFGPVRAEMIAVTEVTRAAAEGQQGLVTEAAALGIEMIDTWSTRNDELVCPICGPLHGRDADGYEPGRVPYWIHPDTGERYGSRQRTRAAGVTTTGGCRTRPARRRRSGQRGSRWRFSRSSRGRSGRAPRFWPATGRASRRSRTRTGSRPSW